MSVDTRDIFPRIEELSVDFDMPEPRFESGLKMDQQSSFEVWAEENHEDVEAIGRALQENEDLAGVLSILVNNKEICAQLLPSIIEVIESHLNPQLKSVQVEREVELVETTQDKRSALADRWQSVCKNVVKTYVALDAGLAEVAEDPDMPAPIGRSWSDKTWEEVELEVANNPRKRIIFANNPELRLVVTGPSRFEAALANNQTISKSAAFVAQKIDRPMTALEIQSQRLNEFLDDSRPGKDIALDSAAAVANTLIAGFNKLLQYDEKLIAATIRMIAAMNLPEKYAKARQYEDQMTEAAANKIIEVVSNYDYQTKLTAIRETLTPNPRQAKAMMAAGVAMTCVAFSAIGADTSSEAPVQVQEHQVELESAPEPAIFNVLLSENDFATKLSQLPHSIVVSPLLTQKSK